VTERSEDRREDQEPRRDLSREEQKFFGRDRDPAMADDPERSRDEDYEAGAAAPAPARTDRADREDREEDEIRARPGRDDPATTAGADAGRSVEAAPLFSADDADSLRTRWDAIQAEFVDEPRSAVEKADALVGDVMQRLLDGFGSERNRLEREWDRGDRVSTEDLRIALKRYRSFFDRLLSV
jgi:hypothetical protein